MNNKSKEQYANLKDALDVLQEGEAIAVSNPEFVRMADNLPEKQRPYTKQSTHEDAKSIRRRLEPVLLEDGLWLFPLNREGLISLGVHRSHRRAITTIERTPEDVERYMAGSGKPIEGFVIGRGRSQFPVVRLMYQRQCLQSRGRRLMENKEALVRINAIGSNHPRIEEEFDGR